MKTQEMNPFTALTTLDPTFRPAAKASNANLIQTWMWRFQSRRALARMEPRMLKDAGLTEADLEIEINKPFWIA